MTTIQAYAFQFDDGEAVPTEMVWDAIDRKHGKAPIRAFREGGDWFWCSGRYRGDGLCSSIVAGSASPFTVLER